MEQQKWDQTQRKWLWHMPNDEILYYETGQQLRLKVDQLNLDKESQEMNGHLIIGQCQEEGLGMLGWGWNLN